MNFVYQAIDVSGRRRRGTLEADSQRSALEWLEREDLVPVAVKVASPLWAALHQPVRIGHESLESRLPDFTSQLASLLTAGIPLQSALAVIAEDETVKPTAELAKRLRTRLSEGQRFAAALEADDESFPSYFVAVVAAAEEAGKLDERLHDLADALLENRRIRQQVRTALIYPGFLLGMVFVTIALLVFVVLPRFEAIFADASAGLPGLTRAVLAFGDWMASPAWLWAVSMLALGAVVAWRTRRLTDRHVNAALSRLPLIGPLRRDFYLARWMRTLASLLKGGVSIVRACALSNALLTPLLGSQAGRDLVTALRRGEALSAEMARTNIVPGQALRMVQIGEESGRMDEMLDQAARILSHRAEHELKRIIAVAVPLATLVLGALIALLVGAVFLGVLSLNQLIGSP